MYPEGDGPFPLKLLAKIPPVPGSTASSTSYSWAKAQLDNCLARHPECISDPTDPLLPTRVLDVGLESVSDCSRNPVKVLQTEGLRGKYLALSHCWGVPGLMPTKLTVHTLEEYQNGIPYGTLPRTFQHAVTAARKLGVQYLWIDSLCIIQKDDDKDTPRDREVTSHDWEHESSRMCSVYQNSYVTLAAASSRDCTGGIFFRSMKADIKGSDTDGMPYQIYARRKIQHHVSSFPLLGRGWVNQESLLPPRTLFCTEQELFWRCRRTIACQCETMTDHDFDYSKDYPDYSTDYAKLPSIDQLRINYTRPDIIKMWYHNLNMYTRTLLTYQTDKLAAMNGIADYMSPLRSGEYLAGLWTDSLAFDLLWHPDTQRKLLGRTAQIDPPTRTRWSSDKWLFPSWSWASVQSQVSWHLTEYEVGTSPPAEVLVDRIITRPPSGHDAYPACQLRLRGVLVPTTIGVIRIGLGGMPGYLPGFRQDELDRDTEVHCLRIVRSGNRFYSLVLLRVDMEKGIYERLGLLTSEHFGSREGTISGTGDDKYYADGDVGLPRWWDVCDGWQGEEVEVTIV